MRNAEVCWICTKEQRNVIHAEDFMGFWEIIGRISDHDYPRNSKKYPRAHRKASQLEKLKFGAPQFKALNTFINKHIPRGELAGDNTKSGRIWVSGRIPVKFRNYRFRPEIAFHEKVERKILRGFKVKRTIGTGMKMRIIWAKNNK